MDQQGYLAQLDLEAILVHQECQENVVLLEREDRLELRDLLECQAKRVLRDYQVHLAREDYLECLDYRELQVAATVKVKFEIFAHRSYEVLQFYIFKHLTFETIRKLHK
uniref:Uncharacterized protein n=1 Tax=Photinus pyralis TaxID=7054 RepID=A0A1Y1MVB8_PHOPY